MKVESHHIIRWGLIVLGTAVLVLLGYVYSPNLSHYGRQALATVEAQRLQNLKNLQPAPAATSSSGSSALTESVNVSGRAVFRKTVVQDVDPVAKIEELEQANAALKRQISDAVAQTATAVQEATRSLRDQVREQVASLTEQVKKATTSVPPMPAVQPALAPQVQQAPAPAPQAQVQRPGRGGVELDLSRLPKNVHITGYDMGTSQRDCTTAQGRKLVNSGRMTYKNGRKFWPNECAPLSDPRPAVR